MVLPQRVIRIYVPNLHTHTHMHTNSIAMAKAGSLWITGHHLEARTCAIERALEWKFEYRNLQASSPLQSPELCAAAGGITAPARMEEPFLGNLPNHWKFFKGLKSPGWCGSVDWTPTCEAKGRWFDSQTGHMPGLQARSSVGGAPEATTRWCFSPFLSLSLPLCKNK